MERDLFLEKIVAAQVQADDANEYDPPAFTTGFGRLMHDFVCLCGSGNNYAVNARAGAPCFSRGNRIASSGDIDGLCAKGLRELLKDDDLWALYKPTGHEINLLRDLFSPLGRGSKSAYREALRLVREFTHSF